MESFVRSWLAGIEEGSFGEVACGSVVVGYPHFDISEIEAELLHENTHVSAASVTLQSTAEPGHFGRKRKAAAMTDFTAQEKRNLKRRVSPLYEDKSLTTTASRSSLEEDAEAVTGPNQPTATSRQSLPAKTTPARMTPMLRFRQTSVDSTPMKPLAESNTKNKRRRLDTSLPHIYFEGFHPKKGAATDKNVFAGVSSLLGSMMKACSHEKLFHTSLKSSISDFVPYSYFPDYMFYNSDHLEDAADVAKREFEFAKRSVLKAETLHVDACEETAWVAHACLLIEHAVGSSPLGTKQVTTVELHKPYLPKDTRRPRSALEESATTPKRRRRDSFGSAFSGASNNSDASSDVSFVNYGGEMVQFDPISVKIDIAVGLDDSLESVKEFRGQFLENVGFDAPSMLKGLMEFPLLPIEVKTEEGDLLEAEFQTSVASSALRASWERLFAMLHEAVTAHTGDSPGEVTASQVMIPPIVAIQIIGSQWTYSIIYVRAPSLPSGILDRQTRHVLGPFAMGSTRTIDGTFGLVQCLRFLRDWYLESWIPDVLGFVDRYAEGMKHMYTTTVLT